MASQLATLVRADLRTSARLLYRRQAEDQLFARTLLHMWGKPRPLEKGSNEIQLHRFDLGAQNLETLTEGEIGGGSTFGDTTFKMKPSHYGDYVVVSDEVNLETYSDWNGALATSLGSRGSLTIDAIHKGVFDGGHSAHNFSPVDTRLSRAVLLQASTLMANENVMGGEKDGMFGCVISPLSAYDLVNDYRAGSILEKSSMSSKEYKQGVIGKVITEAGGVRVRTSTLVNQSGTTRRCYFFGENAYAYTHFAGRMPQFGDSQKRNFRLLVHRQPDGSIFDPMGRLHMSMAYRFSMGVAYLDTEDYRMMTCDVTASFAS